jgi:hypothetical protein
MLCPADHHYHAAERNRFAATVDRAALRTMFSDGAALSYGDPSALLELMEDEGGDDKPDPFDRIVGGVGQLSTAEKTVLNMRFKQSATLQKCAESLGVSRSRIMQIESRALRKLRQSKEDVLVNAGRFATDKMIEDEKNREKREEARKLEISKAALERIREEEERKRLHEERMKAADKRQKEFEQQRAREIQQGLKEAQVIKSPKPGTKTPEQVLAELRDWEQRQRDSQKRALERERRIQEEWWKTERLE